MGLSNPENFVAQARDDLI